MRYLILLFLMACALGEPCTESSNPKYDAYDPSKAVYQKGRVFKHRVSVPGKVDYNAIHQAELSNKGLKLLYLGGILLVLGIAAACSFEPKIVDIIGSFIGFIGFGFIIVGMVFMQIAQIWPWLGIGLLVVVVVAAVSYCRDKGLKLPSKKKLNPKKK